MPGLQICTAGRARARGEALFDDLAGDGTIREHAHAPAALHELIEACRTLEHRIGCDELKVLLTLLFN